MQRRTIFVAIGMAFGASLLGFSHSIRSILGFYDSDQGDPSGEASGVDPFDGDDSDSLSSIGSWSLTVFHKDDLNPDEATPSLDSSATELDHAIYQEAFDSAVESGRGSYSTKDDDEAETLGTIYAEVPENDDDVLCRYVIHDGEVLCVRFMQLH